MRRPLTRKELKSLRVEYREHPEFEAFREGIITLISRRVSSKYVKGDRKGFMDFLQVQHAFIEESLILSIISFMGNTRKRIIKTIYGDQAMFIRKKDFLELECFDDLPLMEDVAFSKKVKGVGKIVFIKAKVKTSNRRFVKVGIIKSILTIVWLNFMFSVGVHPKNFSKYYPNVR